jgi:DNA-binding transcriptional LysR family regulator
MLLMAVNNLDWDDLRFFLETARSESYMGAAKVLKADHTTVRRRIASLQTSLGTRLFQSKEQPLELTDAGGKLLTFAEHVETLVLQAKNNVSDADSDVSGTVRVGAPAGFGTYFLSSRIGQLLDKHPSLSVELAALPRVFNLPKREADVAIAMSLPAQRTQVVRKLTSSRASLYASRDYIAARPINSLADIATHRFITYVPDLIYAPELDYSSHLNLPGQVTFSTTSLLGQVRAVAAGVGIAVIPDYIATVESRLVKVLEAEVVLEHDFWLIVRPELVRVARVRAVMDFIIEQVTLHKALFGEDS